MTEPENYEPLTPCGTCNPELVSDEERERIRQLIEARIEAEEGAASNS
jgi:hypothetical protein